MAKDLELATVAARMRELIGSPEWACYRDIVGQMVSARIDSLVMTSAGEHDFYRGQIVALREALQLPQFLIDRSKRNA